MRLAAWRGLRALAGAGALALAAGCASTPGANPADPLEPMNRAVYQFNDTVDRAVLRPVATGYEKVVPEPARTCVANVFANIGDVWSAVNSLLQGKPGECARTVMRVAVNTTFGLAGCIDIAGHVQGLERHREDFGQTLGKWGMGPGPFLVLPFLGPSTVRDTGGLVLDLETDPVWMIDDIPVRNSAVALRVVSNRADLLEASRVLDESSFDHYTFIRDAYLQRRLNQVYDGAPPQAPLPDYGDFDENASAPPEKTR